uniref:Uncharacterized protein n=1 Tax=Chromera velia CCMP2878 TaxID=1169474 RepID=A0A0G4HN56_9ALVE|eukprot:Cvel_7567.t1-p1 / transcript=Cvel_7567.t1 / gene=Cvel_7567 / organism=Chromera_velia_CCMP2878 / gene_product=hypothetical protein / transcript_product=hypothetical protein / location=Cvel_scaffold398:52934-54004(-) / protein_length=357 / sequence_SO=supercontig / SO=protein_coding / is_pseudo=false
MKTYFTLGFSLAGTVVWLVAMFMPFWINKLIIVGLLNTKITVKTSLWTIWAVVEPMINGDFVGLGKYTNAPAEKIQDVFPLEEEPSSIRMGFEQVCAMKSASGGLLFQELCSGMHALYGGSIALTFMVAVSICLAIAGWGFIAYIWKGKDHVYKRKVKKNYSQYAAYAFIAAGVLQVVAFITWTFCATAFLRSIYIRLPGCGSSSAMAGLFVCWYISLMATLLSLMPVFLSLSNFNSSSKEEEEEEDDEEDDPMGPWGRGVQQRWRNSKWNPWAGRESRPRIHDGYSQAPGGPGPPPQAQGRGIYPEVYQHQQPPPSGPDSRNRPDYSRPLAYQPDVDPNYYGDVRQGGKGGPRDYY